MSYQSTFASHLFEHSVIVVTGGSGIGRCVAHELASLGATVVLIGRSEEEIENVAAEITADGRTAFWHAADIRDEDRIGKLFSRLSTGKDSSTGS